ncbi:MAG TPA: tRNA-uridine aminocarboxypropyltransferase, partial [Pirellulaceae bacterium]|nr:tRNA-uridine aminocarboxypropyltransferase [Pirellulaceae bacterium]
MIHDAETPSEPRRRFRCYTCFRPVATCFCHLLPSIDNRTELLIVQHRREHFHPFNTARLVHRSLRNSSLIAAHVDRLGELVHYKDGAGLLFPGPTAELLDDTPPDRRPRQLVVIDGTWHQAKTLLRDVPGLSRLPRFRLAPAEPSRFLIRKEPTAESLSTVEAVVMALRVLEPDTSGFERLLAAFYQMVAEQDAQPKLRASRRRLVELRRELVKVPHAFRDGLQNIVVGYGELAEGGRHAQLGAAQRPVYWVAERLDTGERFACTIRPDSPLSDSFLSHLQLSREHWVDAVTLDEARARWAEFLKPDDQVTVYHAGGLRLVEQLGGNRQPVLVLKSVDLPPLRGKRTLDDLIAAEQIAVEPPHYPGRAGQRLANAIALVRHIAAGKM